MRLLIKNLFTSHQLWCQYREADREVRSLRLLK